MPVWSTEYNLTETPEQNGFTRIITGSPVITLVTGGSPANRRVSLDTANGDIVFKSSTIPAFDSTLGITAEVNVSVASSNPEANFGIEITFLDYVFAIMIFPNKCWIYVSAETGDVFESVNTASNGTVLAWRATFDAQHQIRVYRAGTLILGPYAPASRVRPFQEMLWWAELGAIVNMHGLRSWLGGAEAP